jgi:hypothetical protein
LTAYERYRQAVEAPPSDPIIGGTSSNIKTVEICAVFLTWLSKGYLPGVAAQKIGVSRTTVFNWRRSDAQFAEAWDEAVEMAYDLVEQEVMRRAVEGYDRPVFQKGEFVGMERQYSDALALAMLGARRRAVYGKTQNNDDKETTVTIKGGLPEGSTVTVHKGGRTETAEVESDSDKGEQEE